MSHNTHLVKRWLTIEKNDISITQMPLNNPAIGKHKIRLVLHETKINTGTIRANNVLCTRVNGRSIGYECTQFRKIKRSNSIRHCQVHGNTTGHSYLMDTKIGISCNYCTGTEINTLSHQVTTDTSFFSLQTLHNSL